MLFRTPVTPLFAGISLDALDGRPAEPLMALLYAGSIVYWAATARYFGAFVAIAVSAVLLAYQGYALMFHELSSEPVFAAAFAGWALLVAQGSVAPSVGRFAGVGRGIASWRSFAQVTRCCSRSWPSPSSCPEPGGSAPRWSAAIALAGVLPLVGWSVHNGVRFDSWGLARGGNAVIPFYRAFITDHIIGPENGEASRRLAAAMQSDLLTREPYRSYGVTLDELFSKGSFRVHEDLYLLSDQVFGWDDDYAVLRRAGIEGVRAHPGTYASGVLRTVWDELARPTSASSATVRGPNPTRPGQTAS